MADHTDPRVAVYLDFDNIVMSWYDRVHGRNAFSRDRQRIAADPTEPEIAERLAQATVDVGALIDHAASFGSIMLTRAYADWSSPVNAVYRSQLVGRAVDLVQLFPAAAYAKNGADIRLAIDAVEDSLRIPDLTHVMIVAGDSDYVPMAQRCKRLGKYVAAVGVSGSSAKSLAAACDQFDSYELLPGIELPEREERSSRGRKGSADSGSPRKKNRDDAPTASSDAGEQSGTDRADSETDRPDSGTGRAGSGKGRASGAESGGRSERTEAEGAGASKSGRSETSTRTPREDSRDEQREDSRESTRRHRGLVLDDSELDTSPLDEDDDGDEERDQAAASRLLARALKLSERDDAEWLHSSLVKTYMRRMDPAFSEKLLGFRSFSEFLKANDEVVELSETGHERLVRAVEPPAKEPVKKSSGGRRRR